MTREEKKQFIQERGWFSWYHPDYFCNKKLVNPKYHDCTNYGMSLEDAYSYETNEQEKERIDKKLKRCTEFMLMLSK